MGAPVSDPPPHGRPEPMDGEWRRFRNGPILPPALDVRPTFMVEINALWIVVLAAAFFGLGLFFGAVLL